MTDTNKDLEVAGTWTLQVASALPPLKTDGIVNVNGQVTIDGDTQPGGRSAGPKIIVNNADNSLQVESSNNVIRNLSFKGGGVIFLKKNGNLVENVWMGLTDDGQTIFLRTPSDPKRLAIGGGVYALSSDNNVIRNNVFMGAFARAVDIQGNNNVVTSNLIGTRADGTVPDVSEGNKCLASFDLDANSWYGGWGMQINGNNNLIQDNRLVGMHNLRSTNDTAPIAIEVFGTNQKIFSNTIGVDINGKEFGVCGQGILASGNGTQILDNRIVRSKTSFESASGGYLDTAILSSDSSPTFGRITVRRNYIKDGPGKVYDFGPGIPTALRNFYPNTVKQINGVNVTGGNGYNSPCPNCLVDVYSDDADGNQEALAYLGSANADASGNWSFTLSAPLPAGTVLRTMSTVQSGGVIGNLGAGTTTKMSAPAQPVTGISLTNVLTGQGQINTTYLFTYTTLPDYPALPITYTVETTDFAPLTFVATSSSYVSPIKWTTNGAKTIKITAVNEMGSSTQSYAVQIGAVERKVFIPLARR